MPAFLLKFRSWCFWMANVTPPNHWAYVQFPAALLLIFALMFVAIARNPNKNKDSIIYGILLKLSYSGITIGYWLAEGIPALWKPFAVIDLVMAALFAWSATRQLRRLAGTGSKAC